MQNELTSPAQFTNPLHATLNGRPVRLLAMGNISGKSPCYLYVDGNGKSDWESTKEFTIIDTQVLPLSQEAVQGLSRLTTQSAR